MHVGWTIPIWLRCSSISSSQQFLPSFLCVFETIIILKNVVAIWWDPNLLWPCSNPVMLARLAQTVMLWAGPNSILTDPTLILGRITTWSLIMPSYLDCVCLSVCVGVRFCVCTSQCVCLCACVGDLSRSIQRILWMSISLYYSVCKRLITLPTAFSLLFHHFCLSMSNNFRSSVSQ